VLIIIWEFFKENPDIQKIGVVIGLMVLLFLLQLFVAQKATLSSSITTFRISSRMRLALGNKLQKLSLGYYKKRDPSDLASVVLQDVTNFENIFGHSIANLANAIFGTIALSIFLLSLNFQLGLTLIAAIFVALPLVRLAQYLVQKYGQKQIASRNATGARFLEYVQGIRHIKSFGMTGERFQSLTTALSNLRKESIKVEAIPGPVVLIAGIVFELFFILMIWVALYLMAGGKLSTPIFIAFLIVGYRLYEPMKILMVEYPILSYMNISLERVLQVLNAKKQDVGQNLLPTKYNICFNQVSFGYTTEKWVLEQISFEAPEKTMTALVGASGTGKTTITSLIARFWDIQQGKITIGGIDLKDMAPAKIYDLISEVFQEVYLFDDSIYNNIKVGKPDATEKEVQEAAQKAQVLEFSKKLPEGLYTKVGEGGSKLSGGQKQRVSIARALLKDAPIVLLDEATASLDPENELYIQQAIQALVKDKLVVVIAHKLATIQQADQILVLHEGKIAERGKHQDLLHKNGLYTKMWVTQHRASGWKLNSNLKTV
ncbi:MAG: ABC transporter ATP-binding protein, partial [Bacteroidota bacterium]